MSEIYTPNAVKVEMIYVVGTQRIENVYHVSKGAPATAADLVALWTIFRDWENVSARNSRNNQYGLVLIALTSMHAAGAPYYEAAVSPSIQGASSTQFLNPFIALCVRHTSGLSGRSYRGRTYWFGLHTGALSGTDHVQSTYANTVAGYYNTLRATLLAAGWTFGVVSRYSGVAIVNGRRKAIPRAQGIFTAITSSTAETGLDTQRHRRLNTQV